MAEDGVGVANRPTRFLPTDSHPPFPQLIELSNIVLGIRLFNRHIGKGGATIGDWPREAADLAGELMSTLGDEVGAVSTLCDQYTEARSLSVSYLRL